MSETVDELTCVIMCIDLKHFKNLAFPIQVAIKNFEKYLNAISPDSILSTHLPRAPDKA